MITKQLQMIIEKYQIEKTNQIIYGTNIPMPKKVIPTLRKTYIEFDRTEYYFFYFDEEGITLYSIDGENCATIFWTQIVDFKINHLGIIGKMTIKTKEDTYKFQINRMVIGCPWIKPNTKYLEAHNYFYPKEK